MNFFKVTKKNLEVIMKYVQKIHGALIKIQIIRKNAFMDLNDWKNLNV